MKICKHMVTPSMRCTEIEGHDTLPVPTNHRSLGPWLEVVEIVQYAIGIMKKNHLPNSALYIEDELKKFGL